MSTATATPSKSKSSKKPVAKKNTGKAAKATKKRALKRKSKASKASSNGAPKRPKRDDELRVPQVRILKYLAKQKRGRTRKEISEGASCDVAMLNSYIGSHDEAKRKANDKKYMVSLLTRKMVKFSAPEGDSKGTHYEITALGKKAAAK